VFVETISWQDFEQVDLRVGTIVTAEVFEKARRPAYILHIDFGPDIGVLKSSAQITDLYLPDELVGQQVLGVVNFPPKQIGPIQSQCLITGFPQTDGSVVLIQPERAVENGSKLA
jgi:tRNA-binding protein